MQTLQDRREREDARRDPVRERWLAVSAPLPVDDDPDWHELAGGLRHHERAA
jgi:hypothetical protein